MSSAKSIGGRFVKLIADKLHTAPYATSDRW